MSLNIPKHIIEHEALGVKSKPQNDALYEPKNSNIQSHISNTSNPHSVTATQVGLGNVPNLDTTNAVNKAHDVVTAGDGISVTGQVVTNSDRGSSAVGTHESTYTHADIANNTAARHTHSNKSTLDNIQEALTTALKGNYDSAYSHVSATNNPHSTTLELARTAGNTISGDINFNKFKAIAMACDNGATLPTSPSEGQWFLHTPTGRKVLLQFTNGAWYPLYSFGAMTLYVDGTNGTNSANLGYGTGASAYKTISYAWTQLPSVFCGNITINVAAGTYAETLTCQGKTAGGAYTITIYGTITTVYTGTISSATNGGTTTQGSITDSVGGFTVNEHRGRFLKFGSTYRPIDTNTVDTLYIPSTLGSTPTGTYEIVEPATIVSAIVTIQDVTFARIKTNASGINITHSIGKAIFENCVLYPGAGYNCAYAISGELRINYSSILPNGGSGIVCRYSNNVFAYGNVIYQRGAKANAGIVVTKGTAVLAVANTVDNFADGIMAIGSGSIDMYPTTNYHGVRNCARGLTANQGGQIINTANNQYSGNTTNENSTTATFGSVGTPSQYLFTGNIFADGNANEIQARIQGHSTQTTNLQTWENSSGTVLAYVSQTGVIKSSGRIKAFSIKSTNYTVTANDEVVVFTATATATLPSATGSGQTYRVCNEGTGTVTIDGNSTDTIKGSLTQTLAGGEDLILTDYASGKWV